MTSTLKYGDGRVWIQPKKFEPYLLLLPYGLTGVTEPTGNMNAVREPSASRRGESEVVDIIRSEPALPAFQLETRFKRTLNYLNGLQRRAINVQGHLGLCDRPDNYYASSVVLHWERARRGDLQMDRLSKIEGDDAPVAMTAPFMAEVGPVLLDMDAAFLSARTIAETEDGTAIAFLEEELFEDCRSQEDAGENGYLVTKALTGSPTNVANVWYTEDHGETWAQTSTNPFAAAMDIVDILAIGTKTNHRVIVANGTTQAAAPAQIAYADVSDMGTTSWITVDVGDVDGEYITDLLFVDWMHVYAATDGGRIYRSQDGGASWTAVYTAGAVDINKMAGLGDGTIWAVGNSNLVVMSNDGGVSWNTVAGPATIAEDLLSVAVTPDGTIFIGVSDGSVYGSFNDGVEYSLLPVQGVAATAVNDIVVWGDSSIWLAVSTASGGRVLRSIDGGASFRLWDLNMPTNSGIDSLFMVDVNTVWAIGQAHSGSTFITRTNTRIIGL